MIHVIQVTFVVREKAFLDHAITVCGVELNLNTVSFSNFEELKSRKRINFFKDLA